MGSKGRAFLMRDDLDPLKSDKYGYGWFSVIILASLFVLVLYLLACMLKA